MTAIDSAGHAVRTLPDGDPVIEELLNSPSFKQDPYPVYARMRAQAPGYWSPSSQMWLVTRADLVAEVASNWEVFSSSLWDHTFLDRLPEELVAELPTLRKHFGTPRIVVVDPPTHTRQRRPLAKSFTPRRVAMLESRLRAITSDLLDDIERSGNGSGEVEFDLIPTFSDPLPIAVIGELFGSADWADLRRWSHASTVYTGSSVVKPETARALDRALSEFRAFILELAAARRREPREDVISDLVTAVDEGDRITEDEMVVISTTLLIAGHETTSSFIGNGVLALLRHPDQLDLLRRQPELLPGAVEELLRYDTSVQRGIRRVTTRDVVLGDQEIPAGMPVTAFLGAANRDPERYDRPDELDVTRPDVSPMSFGGRPHHCLGASLARLEGVVAFGMLLDRFDELRLADGYEERWDPTLAFRALVELPLVGKRADR